MTAPAVRLTEARRRALAALAWADQYRTDRCVRESSSATPLDQLDDLAGDAVRHPLVYWQSLDWLHERGYVELTDPPGRRLFRLTDAGRQLAEQIGGGS